MNAKMTMQKTPCPDVFLLGLTNHQRVKIATKVKMYIKNSRGLNNLCKNYEKRDMVPSKHLKLLYRAATPTINNVTCCLCWHCFNPLVFIVSGKLMIFMSTVQLIHAFDT